MRVVLSSLPRDYQDRIAVVRSIDAPLSTLTVNEICERSGVTRKWFYRHFNAKYDIVYWFLGFCFELSLYEIGRTMTWAEGIEALLSLVVEGKEVLIAEYKDLGTKPKSYYWPLGQRRVDEMRKTLTECRGVEMTHDLEIEMQLYSSMVPDLIRFYLISDPLPEPESYARLWEDVVPNRLHAAMELER